MKLSALFMLVAGVTAQVSVYNQFAAVLGGQFYNIEYYLTNYTGGTAGASTIFNRQISLGANLDFCFRVFTALAPVTNPAVALSIATPFYPVASDFQTYAQNLVSKKAAFVAAGSRSAVVSQLSLQRNEVNIFGIFLAGRFQSSASPIKASVTTSFINPVVSALGSAITALGAP